MTGRMRAEGGVVGGTAAPDPDRPKGSQFGGRKGKRRRRNRGQGMSSSRCISRRIKTWSF
jgi:hypothetical protein